MRGEIPSRFLTLSQRQPNPGARLSRPRLGLALLHPGPPCRKLSVLPECENRERSFGWGNRDLEAEPGSVNSSRCNLRSSGLSFPCGFLRWAGVGNKIGWYNQSHSFPYRCLVRQAGQGVFWGFPAGSVITNPPASSGDRGLIPGLGESHRLRSNSPCTTTTEPVL